MLYISLIFLTLYAQHIRNVRHPREIWCTGLLLILKQLKVHVKWKTYLFFFQCTTPRWVLPNRPSQITLAKSVEYQCIKNLSSSFIMWRNLRQDQMTLSLSPIPNLVRSFHLFVLADWLLIHFCKPNDRQITWQGDIWSSCGTVLSYTKSLLILKGLQLSGGYI